FFFFFSGRRRHTRCLSDWSSDVCSSDLRTARCWRSPVRGLPCAGGARARPAYDPGMARYGMTVPLFDLPLSEHRAWLEELMDLRSEERRVGKEGRTRGSAEE